MITTSVHHPYARLTFDDGMIVVQPKDRDIFLINAEKATEACKEAHASEGRIKVFEDQILKPLHDWCVQNVHRIAFCFVPVPARQIEAFIITQTPPFIFELAEEIAALEMKLFRSGWRVGITQLPAVDESEHAAFFETAGALQACAQS